MEEDRRRTLTGLHDMHTVSAPSLDKSAAHGQRVEHLVLGFQDLVGVDTTARVATPCVPSRCHACHLGLGLAASSSSILEPAGCTRRCHHVVVAARGADDYCAFTKAVEHLA